MEDRLYKFAKIVELGSFTKAAKALRISQPALTTAIKKLERELKSELLIRGTHSFTVTPAGRLAYAAAKELDVQIQNLKLHLHETSQQKTILNLGMIDSIADLFFVRGDYLSELKQSLYLSLTVNNSSELETQLIRDQLDVALIAVPAYIHRDLEATAFADEPLVLVAHPQNTQVTEEMKHGVISNFLSYNRTSQTHRLVEGSFAKQSIILEPSFYSTSPEIMLQLVLAGRGVAVLPYLLIKDYLSKGMLQVIPIEDMYIRRHIVVLRRKRRSLPAALQSLLQKGQIELNKLAEELTQS